jgi:hypothetical protein
MRKESIEWNTREIWRGGGGLCCSADLKTCICHCIERERECVCVCVCARACLCVCVGGGMARLQGEVELVSSEEEDYYKLRARAKNTVGPLLIL